MAVVLGVVWASPPDGSAKGRKRKAPAVVKQTKFRVHFILAQNTRWTHKQTDASPSCDQQVDGSGEQEVFLSGEQTATLINPGPGIPPLLMFDGSPLMNVKVEVNRQGAIDSRTLRPPCLGGGGGLGGGEIPDVAPDCGQKKLDWTFGLNFNGSNNLEVGYPMFYFWGPDPYKNCPIIARWPSEVMICTDDADCLGIYNVVDTGVTPQRLLDPKCKTVIVPANSLGEPIYTYTRTRTTTNGYRVITDQETTELGYNIRLQRIGKKGKKGEPCVMPV